MRLIRRTRMRSAYNRGAYEQALQIAHKLRSDSKETKFADDVILRSLFNRERFLDVLHHAREVGFEEHDCVPKARKRIEKEQRRIAKILEEEEARNYTGTLFSERIMDRHRRWWIEREPHPFKNLAGKLEGPEFVKSHGFNVPVVYHVGETVDSIPDVASLPSRFVVKPSRGWSAKNTFVMVDGFNQLDGHAYAREGIVQALKQNTSIDEDRSLKVLIEEYLEHWNGESHRPPYDYKFHMFGDHLAFCLIVERNSISNPALNRYWYVDAAYQPLDEGVITRCPANPSLPERPICWDDLVDMATSLGKKLDMFMRIDLYATTRGAVFGEFTPQPFGGKGFTPKGDRWLGSLWEGKEGAGD
jgi:hypothetical protein